MPSKASAITGAANKAADKIVKTKPEEEGTGKGAAKQALKDASVGAAEGAATKGGLPGAAIGALKGLSGTLKNNKVFRNGVLMVLAVVVGIFPMAVGIGVLMIASVGSGGASEGVESSTTSSVQASNPKNSSISGAKHALALTGSNNVPWTIVLAANEFVGNDEETQEKEIAAMKKRGPIEYDNSEEVVEEEPPPEPDPEEGDQVKLASTAVKNAVDHYNSVKTDRDKQSSKDSKQVFGWDLYSLSKIIGWADPTQSYGSVANGAVAAKETESRARAIYDPDDGGNQTLYDQHLATRTLYIKSLEAVGLGKADAEKVFDQALEWELGAVGCESNTALEPAGGGEGGTGDWLTPGSEQYVVAQKIFDILTQEYGTSGAFAAGVLGNVSQESGFYPDRSQGPGIIRFGMDSKVPPSNEGGGGGLFQFTPYSKFTDSPYWGKIDPEGWGVSNQVAFMWAAEFQGRSVWGYAERNAPGRYGSLEEWLSTDDPRKAAEVFQLAYERPLNFHAERADYADQANAVFNQDNIKADPKKFQLDGGGGGEPGSSVSSDSAATKCADTSLGDIDIVGGWTIPTTKPDTDAGVTLPGSNNSGWWSTYAGEAEHAAGASDWIRPLGTQAKAAAAGTVVQNRCGSIGCFVTIQHAPTLFTIYGHIDSGLSVGDQVKPGQDLGGMIDLSHYPSPPHVHFVVTTDGPSYSTSNFVKSVKFLKDRGVPVGPARAGDPTHLAE